MPFGASVDQTEVQKGAIEVAYVGAVSLLGRDYDAVVKEYESFGESAFTITLKEREKKKGG